MEKKGSELLFQTEIQIVLSLSLRKELVQIVIYQNNYQNLRRDLLLKQSMVSWQSDDNNTSHDGLKRLYCMNTRFVEDKNPLQSALSMEKFESTNVIH